MNLFRVSLPARSRAAASRGEHNIRGGRTGGEGEPRGLRPEGVALIPFFSRVIQGVMLQCLGTQSAGANPAGVNPAGNMAGAGVALIQFFARCRKPIQEPPSRPKSPMYANQICHRLCLVSDARRTKNMPT